MASKIVVKSDLDIEGYLDSVGESEENRVTHRVVFSATSQALEGKLRVYLENFPGSGMVEFYGWPSQFKIRILSCPWWLRPFLWIKIKTFKWKLKEGMKRIEL